MDDQLSKVFAALADASLYIYLTHFQIYPLFGELRLAGVLAAFEALREKLPVTAYP